MHLPSSINPSSSVNRLRGNKDKPETLLLDFSKGWHESDVFKKYDQIFDCKSIASLQLRKEHPNSVHHRFIVLYMEDGVVHRFDRRPVADANPIDMTTNSPVTSLDTCVARLDANLKQEIEDQSICEIELFFENSPSDILVVFAACYSISRDPDTTNYTIFTHNCFFYAWTILMVVARQHLPHRIPACGLLVDRYIAGITPVITDQVNNDIAMGIEAFLDAIIIFRERNRVNVRPHVDSIMWKILLSIPSGMVRAMGRGALKLGSYLGPRQRIHKAMDYNIKLKAQKMWQNGLARYNDAEPLDAQLWLNNMDKLMLPTIRKQLKRVLWEHIAEIFEDACTSEETLKMVEELTARKKPLLFSRTAWEFRAVCVSTFFASITAVHTTLKDKPYDGHETNSEVFNRLWESASKAAFAAAKIAVDNSRDKVKDPDVWTESWAPVWDDWEAAWAEALIPVRTRLVDMTIDVSTEKYSKYGAELVLAEIREDKEKLLKARIMPGKRLLRTDNPPTPITNDQIQQFMSKIMKDVRMPGYRYDDIQAAMARMWTKARGALQSGEVTSPTPVNVATNNAPGRRGSWLGVLG